jgi:release factor glutamine methyltransferase
MQLREWVKTNKEIFTESDLRFLLKEKLSVDANLIFQEDFSLNDISLSCLEQIKKAYLRGMPMAYILGKEEFFGFEFKVSPHVLIPRKETELIVERAISLIRENNYATVLDLCTGCANIAIAIRKIIGKNVRIFCSDRSLEALKVAKSNCLLHKAEAHFLNADLFKGIKQTSFDLIVSNPPYVSQDEIHPCLQYEPRTSLVAGKYGLLFIKAILDKAYLYLKDKGGLILEIGYNHKKPVERLLEKNNRYEIIEWIKDYDGNWRGVILKNSKPETLNSKQIQNGENTRLKTV